MEWPNFLIIGAARSGTTALYEYLLQHPEIAMTEPKEPHYFAFPDQILTFSGPGDSETINRKAVTRATDYNRLFRKLGNVKSVGEASVSYLYYPGACAQIRQATPEARILCILRHPAERAYSAFSYLSSRLFEPESLFENALADEPRRIKENWHHLWHYRAMGFYGEQLERYYSAFGREQVMTILYDDFRSDPDRTLRECFLFLGVDPQYKPGYAPATNYSGKPKNKLLSRLMTREHPIKSLLKPLIPPAVRQKIRSKLGKANMQRVGMDPQTRQALIETYREDIVRLQDLLGRDLSGWLKSS